MPHAAADPIINRRQRMANKVTAVPGWKQYSRPWYLKLILGIWGYIKNVGLMLWSVIKAIPVKVWGFFKAIGLCFYGLGYRFIKGDWRTKLSYPIFGFGCFSRSKKQIVKGLLWLAVAVAFVLYCIFFGGPQLWKMGSLGDQPVTFDNFGNPTGDDSLQILIYSILSILLIIFFVYMFIKNTKVAHETQLLVEEGKPLSTPKQQLNYALNDGYHVTVLVLPILGILLITILPLIINILVAFTNYGKVDGVSHYAPLNLIDWTGFDAFKTVFGSTYGEAIVDVLIWTLIWAFFATFTNFFFGMFLAMMINKKSIKMKVFWRTCFVLVIAIPDFVTLLMMNKFFSYSTSPTLSGPMNLIIRDWFGVEGFNYDFFGTTVINSTRAKVMVILVNLWRGMPFTMLATYGILMNIPEDLYESSRIDGAGPVRRFVSITFPYIMFVMGPQLITTFTGNINNFNVIFFLTGGGPNQIYSSGKVVGSTNLLITWLYSLTISKQDPEYNYGSVIGIFTFLISAFFALIVFNSSKSVKQEDTFQ